MGASPTQLIVRVDAGPGAEAEELADLALGLRADLDEVDEASVRLAREGAPPPGAKGGDVVEWGTLVVSLVSSGALTALVNTLNAWISRQRGDVTVRIGDDELVLSGASSADRRRLIDDWLAQRTAAMGTSRG
jgi:hypothetical protein